MYQYLLLFQSLRGNTFVDYSFKKLCNIFGTLQRIPLHVSVNMYAIIKRKDKSSILLLPPYRYKAECGSNGVANNERDSRARPALQFYCMIYIELLHKSRHCAYVIYRVKTQFFKEDMFILCSTLFKFSGIQGNWYFFHNQGNNQRGFQGAGNVISEFFTEYRNI